jgi:hypothetical protein
MRGAEAKMEADTADPFEKRHAQTQYLKRFVLRRMKQTGSSQANSNAWDRGIASRFMECPTLENVHHLCLFYGYTKVRSALIKVENAIFEEFFYGKVFLYPLWLKRLSRIFDAAKPRAQVRELLSSQE